ncbi:hypothetical protein ACWF9B_28780 [Streptomyces sp. NPDC055089]
MTGHQINGAVRVCGDHPARLDGVLKRLRIGFRTVEFDRSPDEHGSGFTLVVKDFAYPRPEYDVTVEAVAGKSDTVDVVVSAHTLLRDLLLQADRLDPHAAAGQGLRTLLPGEQARFRVTGCGSVDAKRARAALFCADAR